MGTKRSDFIKTLCLFLAWSPFCLGEIEEKFIPKRPCVPSSEIQCDPELIRFFLYPNPFNSDDFDELIYWDASSVRLSRFNPESDLVLITHGFFNNFSSEASRVLRNGYFRYGDLGVMNLVLVDWGKLSGAYATILEYFVAETIRDFPLYQMAIWNVDVVGERIAQFLIFLQERMRFRGRIHLIGHSLGAHISGVAGRYVYDLTSRMLDRITGTDPAGPLFYFNNAQTRLRETDAKFVDVIHTNSGELGYFGTLGHVDFKINGGGPVQPECENLHINETYSCSHHAAAYFFAQSIGTYDLFGSRVCKVRCDTSNQYAIFGQNCLPETRGVYNVELQLDFSLDY